MCTNSELCFLFQVWLSVAMSLESGFTTGPRSRSLSTRPPWTCPTRGPSACSRSPPASRCRCSAGTWPASTPPSGTPPPMTAPLTRTRSDWVSPRAGGAHTPVSMSSAAPAGWRSCSPPRDEKWWEKITSRGRKTLLSVINAARDAYQSTCENWA